MIMAMKAKKLNPTLWRTCRVLMNEIRLRLFWAVAANADRLNVTGIARLLGIPQPVATNGLRALQSRGLIGVRRERYSVYYNLSEDRSLPAATRLRDAFVSYFESQELPPNWTDEIMVQLKAFSHFNRLAMLRRLAHGEATKADLEKSAGVVVKTVEHHLHYLSRAGLVAGRSDDAGLGVYRLVPQKHPVVCELLRQTTGGEQTYFNVGTGSEKDLRLVHDKNGNRGFVTKNQAPIYD